VAVAELPLQLAAVVAVAELPLQAEAVVAVAELPVHEPDDPVQLPVTFPVTPPLAVISPLAAIVVKLAEDAVVAPIVALFIVPPEIAGLVRVLFVSVSVVARPTSVSVEVGRVIVPVFDIELMTGLVSVLLVSVSVVALPTRVSVDVGSVRVPVFDIELITGVVRVLLVNVCVSIVVTSVFVVGIVVPLIADVAVIAPVTARVPPMVASDVTANPVPVAFVELNVPETPSVPPIVAFPVIGKSDAVPALIKLEGVIFFREVAEAS
jgi:hypothetical protein